MMGPSDFVVRMDAAFGTKIKASALSLFKRPPSTSPLSSFLEKGHKAFGVTKADFTSLLWAAKVSLVKNLALRTSFDSSSNDSPSYGCTTSGGYEETKTDPDGSTSIVSAEHQPLRPAYQVAIYLFSSIDSACATINKALSTWTSSSHRSTSRRWSSDIASFVLTLHRGLSRLPPFAGEVYRKVDAPFVELPLGDTITWNGFSPTATEWSHVVQPDTSLVYVIKSHTARYLGPYSRNPQNGEAIFLPGTTFRILNYFAKNVFVFSQPNIRETSYQATPIDLDRACGPPENRKAGLVIYMEEVV
jgi:hypothetical protein